MSVDGQRVTALDAHFARIGQFLAESYQPSPAHAAPVFKGELVDCPSFKRFAGDDHVARRDRNVEQLGIMDFGADPHALVEQDGDINAGDDNVAEMDNKTRCRFGYTAADAANALDHQVLIELLLQLGDAALGE